MKKLLIMMTILAGFSINPAMAKNRWVVGVPGVPAVAVTLEYISSNAFYYYCHYAQYNIKTKEVISRYTTYYIKGFFTGCPPR